LKAVLAAILVSVAILFVYGLTVGSPATTTYVFITLVLVLVLWLIHRSAAFPLPVLWGLAAVGVGNMLGGVLLIGGATLYLTPILGPLRYDKVFHAGACAVAAWASWHAVGRWSGGAISSGPRRFLAILMAAGAGAVVEMVEFAGVNVFPETNVGDYGNNMLDLVANFVGAAAAAFLLGRSRVRPDPIHARINRA
jgi:hypothetical protein